MGKAIGKAKAKQRSTEKKRLRKKETAGSQQVSSEKDFAYWQEQAKQSVQQGKIDDVYIGAKIAEIVELDTPFGKMVDKLNKALLVDDIDEIKAAGVEMSNYGGISTMQEACEFFVKREFRGLVNMSWNGIGEWKA